MPNAYAGASRGPNEVTERSNVSILGVAAWAAVSASDAPVSSPDVGQVRRPGPHPPRVPAPSREV